MQLLDLISRCKGGEMSVFMAMVAAHALLGAQTVAPSWLMMHTGQSDKTLQRNLARLDLWGLAQQVTTKRWRLTAEGMAIELPTISENLRLDVVEKSVDNPVDNSTGYVIDAVSLRRKFSELGHQVGNSPTSPTTTTTKTLTSNQFRLTEEEEEATRRISDLPREAIEHAQRLACLLCDRVMADPTAYARTLAERIADGVSVEQLELDLLLYAGFVNHGKGAKIGNHGTWILSRIKRGIKAARSERKALAEASPGWGETHPDLGRVDELIELVSEQERQS